MFLKKAVLKLFLTFIVFKTYNFLFLDTLHFTFCRFAILPFFLFIAVWNKFPIIDNTKFYSFITEELNLNFI